MTKFDQFQGVTAIKREIMTNGPVQAGFTVYDDFCSYSDGVYQRTSDKVAGGHAVEIVGWSQDNHGDYWIVKNSWGDGWGMKGYFNIYVDQAEISDEIFAGTPDWSAFSPQPGPTPDPNPGKADSNCT